jgi:hypothetical protein
MKAEESGPAIYTGRKQYIIDNKMKLKGFPHRSKLPHDEITWQDFERILNGETLEKEFHTFPTLKTVLQGKAKSCKMKPLKKRLKAQKYYTNFQSQGGNHGRCSEKSQSGVH